MDWGVNSGKECGWEGGAGLAASVAECLGGEMNSCRAHVANSSFAGGSDVLDCECKGKLSGGSGASITLGPDTSPN